MDTNFYPHYTIDNSGPVFINGNFAWRFQLPFPNGSQCIALQSTSFIQQSIYLIPGNFTISLYYISRSTAFANQIQILLDDIIIRTFCNIKVNTWTLFSISFAISNNSIVVLKFLGTSSNDATTGIDNIVIISVLLHR